MTEQNILKGIKKVEVAKKFVEDKNYTKLEKVIFIELVREYERKEAQTDLDEETQRGNFWAKKYQDVQKETAEKVEKLKIVMSRSYSVGDLLINDIDKIFGDTETKQIRNNK